MMIFCKKKNILQHKLTFPPLSLSLSLPLFIFFSCIVNVNQERTIILETWRVYFKHDPKFLFNSRFYSAGSRFATSKFHCPLSHRSSGSWPLMISSSSPCRQPQDDHTFCLTRYFLSISGEHVDASFSSWSSSPPETFSCRWSHILLSLLLIIKCPHYWLL